jgi:glycosyl transferase family 25
MKAYVISLPLSARRRASIAEELAPTALEFDFVDGVDGRGLTAAERAELVSESAVARYPRWLTPGQIGCALSHLRAYREILASGSDDIALILEDDVTAPATIAELCARVGSEMHGREVVLLYFRAFGVCRFSSQDAVDLGAGTRLMYPLDVRLPITSAAYLITAAAARSLVEAIVPVRAGADSWGHFCELGALDSLRCVLPRPIGVRKDLDSTIDYSGPGSVRLRATSYITRHRVPVASQLLTLNRGRIERRMSKTAIVAERSPVALARVRAQS